MATSKERDKEHGKGHLGMNTPPIVSPQEWEDSRPQGTACHFLSSPYCTQIKSACFSRS
jgi:hypothetical protein